MNVWLHVAHQAAFGGLAAAGFGVLFNCGPRMLPWCFSAGALALAVRTCAQTGGMTLPLASFIAALTLAFVDRAWRRKHSHGGSVLAVVGAIPMVPGSIAAKVLISVFGLLRAGSTGDIYSATETWSNLMIFIFTLVAIGTALAVPMLIPSSEKPDE